MLKPRLILSLCLNDGELTRTKLFRPDRWYTLSFVDLELADEIVLLDVTRPGQGERANFWRTFEKFTDQLFLPICMGGGNKSVADAREAMLRGADKIVINTEAFRRPELITELAYKFGSQAVVVSIDVKDDHVYIDQGREDTGCRVLDWAVEAQRRGAGEILLMDMDRDGSLAGYNLGLIENIVGSVKIPVVGVGGCGAWRHMQEGLAAGLDGAATQIIHHFTAASLRGAKRWLVDHGTEMRI